ncbi:MAG: hypothetical protein PHR28_08915, partial [candidate division Zixibacteria bacterium]|nr:hypothetical protein [candidate division Zixibacteria bacterium]
MKKGYVWAFLMFVFFCAVTVGAQREKPAAALTVEAKVCTGVQDRMPVGEATTFPATVDQVYLWTK